VFQDSDSSTRIESGDFMIRLVGLDAGIFGGEFEVDAEGRLVYTSGPALAP
jgi:hypothetical protein